MSLRKRVQFAVVRTLRADWQCPGEAPQSGTTFGFGADMPRSSLLQMMPWWCGRVRKALPPVYYEQEVSALAWATVISGAAGQRHM